MFNWLHCSKMLALACRRMAGCMSGGTREGACQAAQEGFSRLHNETRHAGEQGAVASYLNPSSTNPLCSRVALHVLHCKEGEGNRVSCKRVPCHAKDQLQLAAAYLNRAAMEALWSQPGGRGACLASSKPSACGQHTSGNWPASRNPCAA